jgi:acetyl esterase
MVLNYGAFDTDCNNNSYITYGGPGAMLGGTEMEDFWKNYLGDQFEAPPQLAVPLHADLRDLPPAFLCVPNCDVLFDENIEMETRLSNAGVETTMRIYDGASHSFLEAVAVAKIAEQAHCDTAEWLIAHLGR